MCDAVIQCHIHKGKKISLPIGTEGKKILDGIIAPESIIPFYRRIGHGNSDQVELVLFVGGNAIEDFCKEYEKLLKPDPKQIPQGKTCLYAVAGGEIEYIQREDDT